MTTEVVDVKFVSERDFTKPIPLGTAVYTTAGSSARKIKVYGRANWVFDVVAALRSKDKSKHEPMYGHMVSDVESIFVDKSGFRDMTVTVILRKNDYAGD